MTVEDYERLLKLGDGRCWICRRPEEIGGRALAVDHCHESQAIRGLLCIRCNQVLGRVHDDASLLRAMAGYLEREPTGLVKPHGQG